jgi:PAS domain S-box-containing protein
VQDLHQIIEASPDATVVVDEHGKIVAANTQSEVLFGYLREEMIDQPIEMLVPDELSEQHKTHRGRYITRPKTRPMGLAIPLQAKKREGNQTHLVPVEIMLHPFTSDNSHLVIAAIRDISHRAEEVRILADAKNMVEMREEFVTVVSHNLKNAVSTINGFVKILQNRGDNMPEDLKAECLDAIARSVQSLNSTLDNMMKMAMSGRTL